VSAGAPQSIPFRIVIRTSSDWTTFALVEGGSLGSAALVSTDQAASNAWLQQGRFLLAQPLPQAELGQQVELVVDVLLTDVTANATLRFEVERGYIGTTQFELFNNLGSSPLLIDTLEWDGITPGDRNVLSVEIPAAGYLVQPPYASARRIETRATLVRVPVLTQGICSRLQDSDQAESWSLPC
jgi:hypothetical protein